MSFGRGIHTDHKQIIFGFIVERRSTAKKLRFKLLSQEVQAYQLLGGESVNFKDIEKCWQKLAKILNRVQLAAEEIKACCCKLQK